MQQFTNKAYENKCIVLFNKDYPFNIYTFFSNKEREQQQNRQNRQKRVFYLEHCTGLCHCVGLFPHDSNAYVASFVKHVCILQL